LIIHQKIEKRLKEMQERTGQEEGEHEGRQAWLMVGEARVKGKGPLQVWQQWRREWMWQ
jgi:hypothetical protein